MNYPLYILHVLDLDEFGSISIRFEASRPSLAMSCRPLQSLNIQSPSVGRHFLTSNILPISMMMMIEIGHKGLDSTSEIMRSIMHISMKLSVLLEMSELVRAYSQLLVACTKFCLDHILLTFSTFSYFRYFPVFL